MKYKRLSVAGLVLVATALPVLAAARPETAQLPITRVVLFSSGVGYYQRQGEVNGNSRIDLPFRTQNINDLLKSLVLQDADGGQIRPVRYDNRAPVERTLKSFAIDLTSNPSLGQLLNQVRGERVQIAGRAERDGHARRIQVTGTIVGVEKQKRQVGKDQVIEKEQLNLLTEAGLQGIALEDVEQIHFVRPELQGEFKKALEVLATGHDKDKKTVTLAFEGNGKRHVRIAYVNEAPIWKASYRLSLDREGKGNRVFLQGWAIVENTTDDDWNNVSMGLVSGRPISFQMDLYEPLFVPRPVVEPELFASLRPQRYEGNLGDLARRQAGEARDGNAALGFAPRSETSKAAATRPQGPMMGMGGGTMGRMGYAKEPAARDKAELDLRQGVASAAQAAELGDYFKYEMEQPVSIARQKSALIPIVNAAVEASRVSIYNPAVLAKYPLLGLRFKNSTGLHLMQGPITVFAGGTYAGDSQVSNLQPGETRLLSYAIDLGTEVAPETPVPADHMTAIKIYKGILHATHKVRHSTVYTVKNRSGHERLVLIEHPYRAEWALVTPEKPAEKTRDLYRFEVKAPSDKPVKLDIVEEEKRDDVIALTNSDDNTVRFFLRSKLSSPKVKEALEKALALRAKMSETQQEIGRVDQELQVIDKDQARMRANMQRLPQTSEAYKRYLKKLDDQETEIEKKQAQVSKLRDAADKERKEYEDYLLNLNVE